MRLLLIEDNERFAELLKRGLAAAGFVVDVLGTAGDAAVALRTNRFEIVVLDLGLPDADGLDVLTSPRPRPAVEDRMLNLERLVHEILSYTLWRMHLH